MKKKIIAAALVIALLIGLQWLFSHAFITVALVNPGSGNVTYQFISQPDQKLNEVQTAGTAVKKLVRKGSYEVLVKQGDSSFLAVVDTGGFLGTTSVRAELAPEKAREFIGNNPVACMSLAGGTLISYGCNDFYGNARMHVSSSAQQPTYTQPVDGEPDGLIQGILELNDTTLAMLKTVTDSADPEQPFRLYTIEANGSLTNGRVLSGLDPSKSYSLRAYKSGFVIYDDAFERISYYSAPSAAAQPISLGTQSDNSLQPNTLNAGVSSITATYSNNTEGEVTDIHEPDHSKVQAEVVIADENAVRRFTLSGQFSDAVTCGRDKLCLLRGDQLEVYGTSGNQLEPLFTLGQVAELASTANGLLVSRENGLIGLDVDTRKGSIYYSFGEYTGCGLEATTSGYLLCLINGKQDKVALRINPTSTNNNSIDKKVAELLKLPEVKDVSAYGRFIYISPELGEPVYDEASNSFGYPPDVISAVNGRINQEIARLGINREAYTIVNTFE
jgi:hypothetical protein